MRTGSSDSNSAKLESDYADIPIIAVDPDIGETYCKWERKNTDNKLIEYLMTSRPMLVETDKNKYFVNIFYQLEYAMPILNMPEDNIDLEEIKHKLFGVIKRDKGKYKDGKSYHTERKKSTIYEKLDWFERYLSTKHNRLKLDIVEGELVLLRINLLKKIVEIVATIILVVLEIADNIIGIERKKMIMEVADFE